MLLTYECYDFTTDSWSLGTVLGGLLFKRDTLFSGLGGDESGAVLADIMRYSIK